MAIGSVVGDFLESFIKRVGDVKDSGVIFPGHGGMMDRVNYAHYQIYYIILLSYILYYIIIIYIIYNYILSYIIIYYYII